MSAQQDQSTTDFLRSNEDTPLIQQLHKRIAEQGRSIDDVSEVLGRHLFYEGEPVKKDGEIWNTCDPAPISFWEVSFADKTSLVLWWQRDLQEPISYEQAKAALDRDRLTYADQQFLDNYVPHE